MENNDTNEQTDISLVLNSDEIKSHLLEAAKWGKFLSIMGYIGIGFIVLAGIVGTIGLSIAGGAAMGATGVPMGFLGVIYLVIALIYYFPVSYLYKFSTQMKQAILTGNTFTLTSGFGNLKSLFKFMGVFTIVMLSLYALIIVIAVPIAMMAGF
ncbi:DUF5362 family protein [Carboxylicivirga linearis]|uniref:DUF5362 domain-containing protein n=1 Tax=Carboxylicivirga linearis TaxID=1628157 RepID=A0ABS5JRN5_9BACT|nr:DUF5362 family protein [Carboxylicivirga linearis]MBS2097502.1 hypothetical protein [Carboxylicivirga linearis]